MAISREALERAVAGGIRAAINDHGGPITNDLVSSAVKRVLGAMKNVPGLEIAPAAPPTQQVPDGKPKDGPVSG